MLHTFSTRVIIQTANKEITYFVIIKQYTNINYENIFALGAVIEAKDRDGNLREKLIGMSRFIRELADPAVAEMAVVVIDEWQGKGCGSQLLQNLIRIAKRKGIQWIRGFTLTQN